MRILTAMLIPYAAVAVFWFGLHNAWLTLVAYHAGCIALSRRETWRSLRHVRARALSVAPPTIVAGPLVYFLLPHMTRVDFGPWLAAHGLSGLAFLAVVPYFGLVHPVFEQVHWAPLRARAPVAHLVFAGYHALVLATVLTAAWLVVALAALVSASWAWAWMERRSDSLLLPVLSHILADAGIIVAAAATVLPAGTGLG